MHIPRETRKILRAYDLTCEDGGCYPNGMTRYIVKAVNPHSGATEELADAPSADEAVSRAVEQMALEGW